MKSLYNFIVKPIINRYSNTKMIGSKSLVINTNIENHQFVSKKAVVISIPAAYNSQIRTGDIVYVHHNIFRRWYDQKGNERNSASYFKDDLYFASIDQIYMYNNKSFNNYCFVKPIKNSNFLSTEKEQPNVGVVKYSNRSLEAVGITPETLITFTPNSEFEFIIDGERLYCMKSNNIAITHEYEGNEKEYNPSWSKGG
tara:strand:+ start:1010 stop:1603 length:594 start_codon:yes stop_codon:yes gene_type:complete